MKRVKEFFNILIYVFDQELNWYEGYVTKDVDEEYAKGYIAGIRMAKELTSKVYRKMYVE